MQKDPASNTTPPLPGNDASYPTDPNAMGAAFGTRNIKIPSSQGGNGNTNKPVAESQD